MARGRSLLCDSCGQEVHPDDNGYWVGADETSDCPESDRGHTVDDEEWWQAMAP